MRRRLPLVLSLAIGGAVLGRAWPRASAEPPPAPAKPAAGPGGWTDPPPDPVENGPGTLVLTVLAEEKGPPLYGSVALWRIDAPGNEHWLPGDRLQATVKLSAGRVEIAGLPEGRYRAVYSGQRGASEDPSAFEVRGPRSEVTLRVPLPRRFAGSLRLVDERGVALRESSVLPWVWGRTYVTDDPPWVKARELRQPGRYWLRLGGGAGGGGSHRAPKRIQGKEGVFAVGTFDEPTRAEKPYLNVRMLSTGRNDVEIKLGEGATGPTTHLGVTLPLALVLQRLALPDGSPVFGSVAKVEATCIAELVTEAMPPDRWRTLPVRVLVTLPGYEPLEVTATADHPSPMPPPWLDAIGRPLQSPW